jgi:hypothetical protein
MSDSALARTPPEVWQEILSYLLPSQNVEDSYKVDPLSPAVPYFNGGQETKEGWQLDWQADSRRRPRKLKQIEGDLRLVCSSWRTFVDRSMLVDLEECDISASANKTDPLQMVYGRPRNVSLHHMNHVKTLRWYTPSWKAAELFASCLRHACQLQYLTLVGKSTQYGELCSTLLDTFIQFAPSMITLRRLCLCFVPGLSRLERHTYTHHGTLELPNLMWLDLFSLPNYVLILKLPRLDTLRIGEVIDECPLEQWDLPSLRFLEIESMSASSAKIVQSRFVRNLQFFSLHLPMEDMPQDSYLDSPLGSVWTHSLPKMIEISHPDPASFGAIPSEHPVLHIHIKSRIYDERIAGIFAIPSSHVRTVYLHPFDDQWDRSLGPNTPHSGLRALRNLLEQIGLNVVVKGVSRPSCIGTEQCPDPTLEWEVLERRNWRLHPPVSGDLREYDGRYLHLVFPTEHEFGSAPETEALFWTDPSTSRGDGAGGDDDRVSLSLSAHAVPH